MPFLELNGIKASSQFCNIIYCLMAVLVMYEGCGEAGAIGAMLASPNTHLLKLPCRGASASSIATTASVALHSFPVVVIASCSVIDTVIASLATNTSVEGSSIFPVPSISLPTCFSESQQAEVATTPTLHPIERVLNILLSWMTYHSWNTLTVLHDRFLHQVTFAFFRKYIIIIIYIRFYSFFDHRHYNLFVYLFICYFLLFMYFVLFFIHYCYYIIIINT